MEKELLKEMIDKLGLKKKHVAKQIGCTPVELSHYLGNRRDLRPECYTKLINYLGV